MRGTASGERERGCVRDRRPVMRCPSKRGKLCICSHALRRLFIKQQYKNSSGQPFSAAEAAFSITSQAYYGLQLKSMPRPRPSTDMLFHQYVYFGLDPTPPAFRTLFFSFSSSYSRTVFFSSPAPPEASFCWSAESLHSIFKWSVKISILYFPESSFPSLSSSSLYACPFFLHSSLPHLFTSVFTLLLSSSCPWSLFILLLLQPSTFSRACSISTNSSSVHLHLPLCTHHFSPWLP